jgi:transposase
MNNITVLGIDLAKNIFQLHGTDSKGHCIMTKRLTRQKLTEWVANLNPCLIGIEACGGSHYWARLFKTFGHDVKMISPHLVKPYVRNNKNDKNDARAIAEAVTRPDMKFVGIKTIEQQDILSIHRARELVLKNKVAQSNQIRGLLGEYGIVIPQGEKPFSDFSALLSKHENNLTERAKKLFNQLYEQYKFFKSQLKQYDKEIVEITKQDEQCQKIMKIDGIGPITASAITATIGSPKIYKSGRELAACLGLVPKQKSSGNKTLLLGISKRGDRYLRKLLVHGARSAMKTCSQKTDPKSIWIQEKKAILGWNKTAVAIANKHVRVIWAVLTKEAYNPNFKSVDPRIKNNISEIAYSLSEKNALV